MSLIKQISNSNTFTVYYEKTEPDSFVAINPEILMQVLFTPVGFMIENNCFNIDDKFKKAFVSTGFSFSLDLKLLNELVTTYFETEAYFINSEFPEDDQKKEIDTLAIQLYTEDNDSESEEDYAKSMIFNYDASENEISLECHVEDNSEYVDYSIEQLTTFFKAAIPMVNPLLPILQDFFKQQKRPKK